MKVLSVLLFCAAGLALTTVGHPLMGPIWPLSVAFFAGLAGVLAWKLDAKGTTSHAPPPPQAVSDGKVERLEALLLSMQDDLAKVREDREFYERLYKSDSAEMLPGPR